jgi:hypothetical protein
MQTPPPTTEVTSPHSYTMLASLLIGLGHPAGQGCIGRKNRRRVAQLQPGRRAMPPHAQAPAGCASAPGSVESGRGGSPDQALHIGRGAVDGHPQVFAKSRRVRPVPTLKELSGARKRTKTPTTSCHGMY